MTTLTRRSRSRITPGWSPVEMAQRGQPAVIGMR
jgi:hypothetical protein